MLEQRDLVGRIADAGTSERERLLAERELCTHMAPRIRLYGLRHLRNEAAAADLVQEVLVILLKKAREGSIETPEHVERFVLGTCRNLVAHTRRSEIRTRRFENVGAPLLEDVAPPSYSQVDAARLALCLGKASPRDQRVVLMTFQDDRSAEDIAAELGTSAGNVRVLRHRVLAALQRCVEGVAA